MTCTISLASEAERLIGRRVDPRLKCDVVVQVKDSAGGWQRVLLVDLSARGFRLGLAPTVNGDSLWLQVDGFEPLPAKVRWKRDATIGCQFLYPLERAAYSALSRRLEESALEAFCE